MGVTTTGGRLRVFVHDGWQTEIRRARAGTSPSTRWLVSAGWTPSVHMVSQSRGKLSSRRRAPDIFCRVRPRRIASRSAPATGPRASPRPSRRRSPPASRRPGPQVGRSPLGRRGRQRVGRAACSGAAPGAEPGEGGQRRSSTSRTMFTAKDIGLRPFGEGMRSIEHVKRFTTNGMATDQGKNVQHAWASPSHRRSSASRCRKWDSPPFVRRFTPVTFGAIVGHGRGALFDVTRMTPIHSGGRRIRGAPIFEDGRAVETRLVFPEGRRGHARRRGARVPAPCVSRPAFSTPPRSARSRWSDRMRPEFMELVYTNPWKKLGVGRCRYGLMLREDGVPHG